MEIQRLSTGLNPRFKCAVPHLNRGFNPRFWKAGLEGLGRRRAATRPALVGRLIATAAGMITSMGKAASKVKARAFPRAEARGGEAKDPEASPPHEARRAPPTTEEQHRNVARRNGELRNGSGQRPPLSTTSCGARGALERPRMPASRAEARRRRRAVRPPRRPGSSERPEAAGVRTTPRARAAQVPASLCWDASWAPRLCCIAGPERIWPGRREPGTWPGDRIFRTWRQKVAAVAL